MAPIFQDELARQVGDAPKEEHDGGGTQQRAHRVDHACHIRRIAHKLRKEIGREHEERCPGRVAYFEFVTCGDEFRTVPKAGCRLNGRTIHDGGNQECEPTQRIVH